MRTQYYTAASLDGFVATDDHALDWLFALGDPEEPTYEDFIADVGAIAMGSGTYTWLLRHHVRPGDPDEQPWPYTMPVFVFSSRDLPRVAGDVRYVRGDVRSVHPAMVEAAAGKNVWIAGGGDLAAQLLDAGLLDELIVQVGSALLGSGRPMLPRRTGPGALRLSSVRRIGKAFVELRYDVVRG